MQLIISAFLLTVSICTYVMIDILVLTALKFFHTTVFKARKIFQNIK